MLVEVREKGPLGRVNDRAMIILDPAAGAARVEVYGVLAPEPVRLGRAIGIHVAPTTDGAALTLFLVARARLLRDLLRRYRGQVRGVGQWVEPAVVRNVAANLEREAEEECPRHRPAIDWIDEHSAEVEADVCVLVRELWDRPQPAGEDECEASMGQLVDEWVRAAKSAGDLVDRNVLLHWLDSRLEYDDEDEAE